MEENAHCTSPEKLSSLAFCLSMISLCVCRGPRRSSQIQRDKPLPGSAVPEPSAGGLEHGDGRRPGECGDSQKEHRGCDNVCL